MHNLIVANVVGEMRQHLRGKPCRVYPSDLRVKVSPTGLYTYPDVVVVCGQPQFEQPGETLTNPTLLVEVLSDSSEAYERGKKSEQYRTLPTLTDYLLIAQDRVLVEHYSPPGQKFCGDCGAVLGATSASKPAAPEQYTPKHLAERILGSRSAMEGERKQVSVLFADLKGSMELLADRDRQGARRTPHRGTACGSAG